MVVVSGFLPVPLPMMIPFMGAQSLVIGKMFGEGFQYGKRKISAMPNEEFNALTFQNMMQNARDEMQKSIPTMQAALKDMQPLVETVVHEFFDYIKIIAAMLPEETRALTGGSAILDEKDAKILNLTQDMRDYLEQQGKLKSSTEFLHELGIGAGAHQGKGVSIPLTTVKVGTRTIGGVRQPPPRRFVQGPFIGPLVDPKTGETGFKPAEIAKLATPIVAKRHIQFRKAGQSQRLERTKLIREINTASNEINRLKPLLAGTPFAGMKRILNIGIGKQVTIKKRAEQLLANLLKRYRF